MAVAGSSRPSFDCRATLPPKAFEGQGLDGPTAFLPVLQSKCRVPHHFECLSCGTLRPLAASSCAWLEDHEDGAWTQAGVLVPELYITWFWQTYLPLRVTAYLGMKGLSRQSAFRSARNLRNPLSSCAWTACTCSCRGCSRRRCPAGQGCSIQSFNQTTQGAATWGAFFADGMLHGFLRLECHKGNVTDGYGGRCIGKCLDLEVRSTSQHVWAGQKFPNRGRPAARLFHGLALFYPQC